MYINKINGKIIPQKKLTEVIADIDQAEQIELIQKEISKDTIKDEFGKSVFAIDSKEFIEEIISSKRGEVVLYYNDDELVGFFELSCPDDSKILDEEYSIKKYIPGIDCKNVGVAESIVVFPKYRGNGLQVKMFTRMEEIAQERDITSLIGTVHPKNIYSCHNFNICNYKTVAKIILHGGERYLKYKPILSKGKKTI